MTREKLAFFMLSEFIVFSGEIEFHSINVGFKSYLVNGSVYTNRQEQFGFLYPENSRRLSNPDRN